MTISNERLRELSIDEWSWASNIEERMSMAAELLAARERIDELSDDSTNWESSAMAEKARAEKAEAERDSMVSSEFYREAVNSLRVVASERDAARAEANHLLQKYQDACDDLHDRTRERDEAIRRINAMTPEAKLLRAYQAMDEAAKHVEHATTMDKLTAELARTKAWKTTTEQVCKILGADVDSLEANASLAMDALRNHKRLNDELSAACAGLAVADKTIVDLSAYRDRTEAALSSLREAVQFYDAARADQNGKATGAVRDGLEWVLDRARDLARDAKGAK